MSNLNQFTDANALEAHLEECDTAYSRWNYEGENPLPDDDEVRAALERVHGLTDHPRCDEVWEEAYLVGHSDGVGRIACEYARIARWLK